MTYLSRPTYGTLSPQPGRAHLLLADGDGLAAIADMARHAPDGFFTRARIILAGGPAQTETGLPAPARFDRAPSVAAALALFRQALAESAMGLRLYLAGSESLIGQGMQAALEAGLDMSAIATEHRGTASRRVQCVHCKGFIEDVTTQPVPCPHCGVLLLVRDHYSRRLAAFQGVCINAEDPAWIPQKEEIFR